MKINLLLALLLLSSAVLSAQQNSFKPAEIWQDNTGTHINAHGAGFLFHEGKYYWFGEHKIEGEAGNLAQVGVGCYSSSDLYNWKNEGIALKVEIDSKSEIVKGSIIERPKVVYNKKTGKFAMWFHLEHKRGDKPDYTTARTALAISDNITGPYKFVKSFRPQKGNLPIGNISEIESVDAAYPPAELDKIISNQYYKPMLGRGYVFVRDMRSLGQMARDMTVFVDDDEKAYLICASEENSTLQIHELTDDYQDFTGKFARITPSEWNEAPAIFKKDGIYYLITSYCTGWAPNAARSYKSKSIWGEWEAIGNPCVGTPEQMRNTFTGQSTYIIKVEGKKDAFIFVADRWNPKNAIDGRYIFLPIEFENSKPKVHWYDIWDLSKFDK